MRKIIRTLIEEGIEREDIVAIASYLMEEYEIIDEYIKKDFMNKISATTAKRQQNTDKAPEGPEKETAIAKEQRNADLTNRYIEHKGSALQKATNRGYSKNAKEKKALLKAGWTLKEDPIVPNRHNITKY